MTSTFSQMNPIVINTTDMDPLVDVLLKFYSEDMNSWHIVNLSAVSRSMWVRFYRSLINMLTE